MAFTIANIAAASAAFMPNAQFPKSSQVFIEPFGLFELSLLEPLFKGSTTSPSKVS